MCQLFMINSIIEFSFQSVTAYNLLLHTFASYIKSKVDESVKKIEKFKWYQCIMICTAFYPFIGYQYLPACLQQFPFFLEIR